ncbi:MAG: ATP synthase subunit I [Chromatiales bacterium]|nr:ATP synthase subunit I [Chromatiales bacterium]
MRTLLLTQTLLIALVVVAYLLVRGSAPALAAVYGGGIALINSLLLSWRVARGGGTEKRDEKMVVLSLYFGAVERFVFTLVAMGVGMGYLNLDPPAMLIAFAVAQVGFAISGYARAGAV